MFTNRSFWGLTITQFLGAFNDNAFRQFTLLLALTPVVTNVIPGRDPQALIMGLFLFPFVAFGLLAGSLADRLPKRRIVVAMKWAEAGVMALAMASFAIHSFAPDDDQYLTIAVVASLFVVLLMGTQSAIFGPAKYGMIPEIVPSNQLTRANGVISLTTQIAIVLGIWAAGRIRTTIETNDLPWHSGGYFFVAVALAGVAAAHLIRTKPAANPDSELQWNVTRHVLGELRWLSKDRDLFLAILAMAWWWMIGTLAIPALNLYGKGIGLPNAGTDLMVPLAIGIGAGSILAVFLTGKRIAEIGLVPVGALGMALSLGALYYVTPTEDNARICMFLAGVFGGLYNVPLAAFTQHRPEPEVKGRVMGIVEIVNFTFMFMSAGVYALLVNVMGLDAKQVFLAAGALMLAGASVIFLLTPQYVLRMIALILTKTLYRVKILGAERIPDRGGALIVSNHVSFVDPFMVGTAVPRWVNFIMHRGFLNVPFVGFMTRIMKVIPIAEDDPPRELLKSLNRAAELAKSGQVVCIFAEGGITRTGNMLPFSKGLERIAKKANVPIVPMFVDRLWGSIFSFGRGRFFFKKPQRVPYPVTVNIGEPLPPDAPTYLVRQAVQKLGAEAHDARKRHGETLATRFMKTARRHPRRLAVTDTNGRSLTYRRLLQSVLVMRELLGDRLKNQEFVGVLLPPSVGGAIANLSLAILGRTSVNLNFTAGPEAYASAIKQTQLETILTSKTFLEKAGLESDPRHVYLEDLLAGVSSKHKFRAGWRSFLPSFLLTRLSGVPRDPDRDVSVIFSSGSTGDPKGVVLTHHNVLSNSRSFAQVFDVRKTDVMIGVLPFFHSFGYTGTMWFPLISGIAVAYHPNPMDAKVIGELIRDYKGTILLSTPTFYQAYLRRFAPEDIASLRIAGSGAEKLKPALSRLWHEKFDTHILEGYGCTELSPGVSINTEDYKSDDVHNIGHKLGTVGHPLPGNAAKIVHPETFEELGADAEGLLLITGANVMSRYLNQPDLTDEVIRDGWYVTGDIARIDDDGFITITDRMSRFSKIGGEMVPHVRVESEIQAAVVELDDNPESDPSEVAVTAVADDRKGEKLVVLHTHVETPIEAVLERLKASALPNLWIPRKDCFVEVEEIPKLGSGKLDLKSIKSIAQEHVQA